MKNISSQTINNIFAQFSLHSSDDSSVEENEEPVFIQENLVTSETSSESSIQEVLIHLGSKF